MELSGLSRQFGPFHQIDVKVLTRRWFYKIEGRSRFCADYRLLNQNLVANFSRIQSMALFHVNRLLQKIMKDPVIRKLRSICKLKRHDKVFPRNREI